MNALTPTTVRATIKFFDPARGFGFATAPDFAEDLLLPGSRLIAAGRSSIAAGTSVMAEIRTAVGRPQIERIVSIDIVTPAGALRPGRVKWFDTMKGYGFIQLLGEPGDVFLGREVLRISGRDSATPGEALAVIVMRNAHGLAVEAVGDWV
ncbi:cold-shock protein [Limimaricola pyoseonensis]|uniref:Cold shock protein (Beta-ribbon, CspA family) n=1 Tax=Limimaricola pyoseonensis TaxID=521013 RepID=A0A1G7GS89_9RHOB|nr:cold shock domain-containing protein [Limimaricola pyoseonensis]SDE90986.1 cold shock protein (beta-ribbon, CspA family) [Limimaricola pyoseonensis]